MKIIRVFLIIALVIISFICYFFYYIPYFFEVLSIESLDVNASHIEKLILGVFIAPLFETLVFLSIPFYFWINKAYKWLAKTNIVVLGLLSSFLFAITHSYSQDYILLAFMAGVYFFINFLLFYYLANGLSVKFIERFLKKHIPNHYKLSNIIIATICVALIHYANNGYAYYLDYFA